MYPQAARQWRNAAFFYGNDCQLQKIDIKCKGKEGGKNILETALSRLVAGKTRQQESENEERQRRVDACLPFAEMFGAAIERRSGEVAQAVAGDNRAARQLQLGTGELAVAERSACIILPGQTFAVMQSQCAAFALTEFEFKIARSKFILELKTIKEIILIPTQANYITIELLNGNSNKLSEVMLDKDIFIKDLTPKTGWTNKQYIRVAIRNEEDNKKFIDELKEYFREYNKI